MFTFSLSVLMFLIENVVQGHFQLKLKDQDKHYNDGSESELISTGFLP